ncbi:YaiI/YqxD family protein [Rhodovibrionaceae bacterium A322]
MQTEIYVDCDACPVKEEAVKVADRHGLTIHMVSNAWMRLPDSPRVQRVIVSDSFDAADDWIAERANSSAIVITGDIPLADRCLKAGAQVMGHNGKAFSNQGIGMAMAMRDLNAVLRDSGEIKGGGPSFSKKDRSRFLEALEQAVQKNKRQQRLAPPPPRNPAS